MRLLFIFGAHAAGKMTVGQVLSRITPMKLFHNHMTIEPGGIAEKLGIAPERYLRIENEQLSPEKVAAMIADHFGYERRDGVGAS